MEFSHLHLRKGKKKKNKTLLLFQFRHVSRAKKDFNSKLLPLATGSEWKMAKLMTTSGEQARQHIDMGRTHRAALHSPSTVLSSVEPTELYLMIPAPRQR